MHQWTEGDDLAALYVYKFGVEKLPYSIEDIAARKGIKVSSFRMRILNFQALDDRGGLENYAKQSKEIYDHYRKLPEADLRRMAFPELFQTDRSS
jgi:hypothetical protein